MSILAAVAVPHPPIILPQVGKGEEQKIKNTIKAYKKAMKFLAAYKPETVVIISPHSVMYRDYFHVSPHSEATGNMARFNAPDVKLRCDYDKEFVSCLEQICRRFDFPCGTSGEQDASLDHGTFIPLHFFDEAYSKYQVVRIGLSDLSLLHHYELGRLIALTADKLNRRTVIIASGDLSHKLLANGPYGFVKEGPIYDQKITSVLQNADFMTMLNMSPQLCEAASECGHRSFVIMAGALDGKKVKAKLLSYEGPFGVGYGVAQFAVGSEDKTRHFGTQYLAELEKMRQKEDAYVQLARQTVETYVTSKKMPLNTSLPTEMLFARAGAFVSIKKRGILRGCIGTINAAQNCLAAEIMQNAVAACSRDPRFEPVRAYELSELVYSVDILMPTEPVSSIAELNAKKYGVIVENGNRRGLLLPDIEGVDTPQQQIAIAKQKAGIGENEDIKLSRFEVVRHKVD